ncbi:MAG: TIGR00730 family Rossman fold protein [Thiopseudomonas sp.]|nr:TIGR00730 family Rossman fold protein [Thiopseudomonas sp.]MCK9465441.1 TIGR00730 family Rossman fold protein [Thiopseudomonas sp.]
MSYETEEFMERQYLVSDVNIGEKVNELISAAVPPNSPNIELYREMMLTVARMAESDRSRWDAKIMMQTLKELEASFALLDRFKRRRKVTVFGSARTAPEHPLYQQAMELGKIIAQHNLMVITGAGGGIMAAAHEGAGTDNSLGLNIVLPFEQGANDTVKDSGNLLTFHFFFLRKLFFVKEADALVLCPGGFGTQDEAWEVLTLIQTGKSPLVPVVLLEQEGGTYWSKTLEFMQTEMVDHGYISAEDLGLLHLVYTPEEAGREIAKFYSNYHSTRWLRGRFVIRMHHELKAAAIDQLNQEFSDLCKTGNIEQVPYCAETHKEPEFCKLYRLEFVFNARDFGRLRQLVNFINQPENWQKNA